MLKDKAYTATQPQMCDQLFCGLVSICESEW